MEHNGTRWNKPSDALETIPLEHRIYEGIYVCFDHTFFFTPEFDFFFRLFWTKKNKNIRKKVEKKLKIKSKKIKFFYTVNPSLWCQNSQKTFQNEFSIHFALVFEAWWVRFLMYMDILPIDASTWWIPKSQIFANTVKYKQICSKISKI